MTIKFINHIVNLTPFVHLIDINEKTKVDHYTDKEALEFHSQKPGKIEISSSKNMTTKRDLALAYSPGVAAPVRTISDDPNAVYEHKQRQSCSCYK